MSSKIKGKRRLDMAGQLRKLVSECRSITTPLDKQIAEQKAEIKRLRDRNADLEERHRQIGLLFAGRLKELGEVMDSNRLKAALTKAADQQYDELEKSQQNLLGLIL
jgi:hypothetical protein